MANFKIESLVADILNDLPATRSDDYILYREVCNRICPQAGALSLSTALERHKSLGMPSWETVSRCRRKIQERNPDLRDPATAKVRAEEEQQYKEYARGA
ncbi:MAG: hypothetical protein IJH40_07285 [Ruminococcus sp.]|uniref:hypothetical protein n=1 Tax=Ruminococcus sp. TaxID=41978 RepID=UPI002873764B|nr:hypothetical protein [Ruminococcus sp.]MBQ3285428.1 hypothetical protein [Ruminococcus sp.]